MLKHRDVHLMPDDYLLQQRDEMRKRLATTEEELKSLKIAAKMPFPEETNRSVQRQIAKVQDDLLDAQRELLERKAMGGQVGGAYGQTNGVETYVPADKLNNYTFATTKLEELKRQESELLLQYTEAYPLVQNVRDRIRQARPARKLSWSSTIPAWGICCWARAHGSTNTGGHGCADRQGGRAQPPC